MINPGAQEGQKTSTLSVKSFFQNQCTFLWMSSSRLVLRVLFLYPHVAALQDIVVDEYINGINGKKIIYRT